MDPILVQLGPLSIRWYGLLIALGVLVGSALALRYAERRGLDPERLLDLAPWLVIAGVVGARVVYVITSPAAFFGPNGNLLDALKVWQGGISIHGGVIGIVVATWLYCRAHKLNMWAYLDAMSPIAGLGIIGGRIGNFMNGTDTGGRLTNWPIGFTWPDPGTETFGAFGRVVFGRDLWSAFPGVCSDGSYIPLYQCTGEIVRGPVHLTQMYGVLIGAIVLLITLWALNRRRGPGYAFWQMVLWYSVLRAVLEETFRDNPLIIKAVLEDGLDKAGIGLFTVTQLASVVLIVVAAFMIGRSAAAPFPPPVLRQAVAPGPAGGGPPTTGKAGKAGKAGNAGKAGKAGKPGAGKKR
jgi:phosphatidylglycerol:prolipoprotein diacylglycerol transferase